jgi:uncharacterized SAM-dependent methyltransferase
MQAGAILMAHTSAVLLNLQPNMAQFLADVIRACTFAKTLPVNTFTMSGSQLFDEICELPEYYSPAPRMRSSNATPRMADKSAWA